MLETLRSYWSIISTIITVVAVPAVGYLYKKYKQADARQKAVELGVQASSVTALCNLTITMRSVAG